MCVKWGPSNIDLSRDDVIDAQADIERHALTSNAASQAGTKPHGKCMATVRPSTHRTTVAAAAVFGQPASRGVCPKYQGLPFEQRGGPHTCE